MKKKIDTAAHYVGVAALLAEFTMPVQPQVNEGLILLYSGHRIIDGPLLDLWGSFDRDGYEVQDIALTGTKISLYEIIDEHMFKGLSDWCDDNLASCEQMYVESKMDAKIDAAEYKKLHD
jgi:hypothetical protein